MKQIAITLMMGAILAGAAPAQTRTTEQMLPKSLAKQLTRRLTGLPNGDIALNQFEIAEQVGLKAAATSVTTANKDVTVPLILNGYNGNERVVTTLTLLNTTAAPAQVIIEFFDKNGNRTELPFADNNGRYEGAFESASGLVPDYALGGIATYATSPQVTETWARVRSNPAGAIRVLVNHVRTSDNGWTAILSAGQQPQRELFYSIDQDEQDARFLVVNTASVTQAITLRARSQEGDELCRWVRSITPNHQILVRPGTENICMQRISGSPYLLQMTTVSSTDAGVTVGNYLLDSGYFTEHAAFSQD